MSKAPRLLPAGDLQLVREQLLTKGGVIFRRMCPRNECHSVVVRHRRSVVCLTCGWSKRVGQWGENYCYVTPQQAVQGSRADFRGLALVADPRRWSRLIRRARRRGNWSQAGVLQAQVSELSPVSGLELRRPSASSRSAPRALDGRPLQPNSPLQLGTEAAEVVIYTDGGCDPNPGPGGWAALLWSDGWELEIAGRAPHTTNNRMELKAALEGLRALSQPSRVTIITDSAYLSTGMTAWITGWSKRNWMRDGKRIPNTDLWQSLARASLEHETYWSWTKGHAGHTENERCDRLANAMTVCEQTTDQLTSHHRCRQRNGRLPKVRRKATAAVWLPH